MNGALLLCGALAWSSPAWPGDEAALKAYLAIPQKIKQGTPIAALQTLCFAADGYSTHPILIKEAINCLDIDQAAVPIKVAGLLALELEEILDDLGINLGGLAINQGKDREVVHEEPGISIAMEKGKDGLWRFNRQTVARIPAMRQAATSKVNAMIKSANQLLHGRTDPTTTMVTFLAHVWQKEFDAATEHLDLNFLSPLEKQKKGRMLAWKLACVIQRRGYVYSQEVPGDPESPPFTWLAEADGRISVRRVKQLLGKDSWLFDQDTTRAIETMWENVKMAPVDQRYKILGREIPAPPNQENFPVEIMREKPASVPDKFSTPRRMVRAFFAACLEAEFDDAAFNSLGDFLDLQDLSPEDRGNLGPKRAGMLEAILRKMSPDTNTLADSWASPTQTLKGDDGLSVDIVRDPDGYWRFGGEPLARLEELYKKLDSKDRMPNLSFQGQTNPRQLMFHFLVQVNRGLDDTAAACLDLSTLPAPAINDIGPILAFKLKYIIDRLGTIYFQEIPNDPNLRLYVIYRGQHGKITLAPEISEGKAPVWKFTSATVAQVETMFRALAGTPVRKELETMSLVRTEPYFWLEPGIWIYLRIPRHFHREFLGLEVYQWIGCVLVILAASSLSYVLGVGVRFLFTWFFPHADKPAFRRRFRRNLRAFRFLFFFTLLYQLIPWIDLPLSLAAPLYFLEKVGMTLTLGWFGLQVIELVALIYDAPDSEDKTGIILPMMMPFITRIAKVVVVVSAISLLIMHLGKAEALGHFLAGLGILGIGISLAAQDSLKNLFGTLLIIGDRTCRVGDHIIVNDKEGVIEEVGFRATKMRTPDGSLLIFPNGMLAASIVDNLGLRIHRRVRLLFSLDITTPLEKINAVEKHLMEFLNQQPNIVTSKTAVVFFKFGETGLDFEIVVYAEVPTSDAEQILRESILEGVIQITLEKEARVVPLKVSKKAS
ncbi:MAG: mechanosensitive ion channel [Gemmataceae bacterium]|nr:mechanosensitive ion channel [Gemmataceae bacterium]